MKEDVRFTQPASHLWHGRLRVFACPVAFFAYLCEERFTNV
jgi:hypothetical protein